MSFKDFLSYQINESFLTRKECIAKLNLYHDEFINLDSVTFSRWMNGRTIPSLLKQLLICDFFQYDIFVFIKKNYYSITNKGKILNEKFNKIMKDEEPTIGKISYYYTEKHDSHYTIHKYYNESFQNTYKIFYSNFEIYNNIFLNLYDTSKKNIHITFEERINNHFVSHDAISLIKDVNTFSSFFNLDEKCINSDFFWFGNLGYLRSRQTSIISHILLLYFIYMTKSYFFISLLRSEQILNIATEIGYKQITKTIFDNNQKLYLTRCDIFDAISHPFVITQINKFLNEEDIDTFFSQEIKEEFFKR
ncbi:hypothetical protein I3256_08465 [Photobacterium damselae]|uniref:hypothetical protein n=1 Tax=Photobacterium damselae TaxID=38293 RepID=UPI001EDFC697|nr:hypothetical protein [Photobacterium damselae]MCG3815971.1 hypothetical protein [Photobacterium damselae]